MFLRLRKLFNKERPVRASQSLGAGYGTTPNRNSDLDMLSITNPLSPINMESRSDVFVRHEDPAPVLSSCDSYSSSSYDSSSSSSDSGSSSCSSD